MVLCSFLSCLEAAQLVRGSFPAPSLTQRLGAKPPLPVGRTWVRFSPPRGDLSPALPGSVAVFLGYSRLEEGQTSCILEAA